MDPVPITVSKLNRYIKSILSSDKALKDIFIEGEISNFKKQFLSGHLYFTLKDEVSVIPCIMFNNFAQRLEFLPKDGEKVEMVADLVVYEQGGRYQLNVKAMRKAGIGDLYLKFEELKKKLLDKGYFSKDIKKEIPMYPKKIGVATSKTGAVIQDIINVGTKRNPKLNLTLYPVKVQGEGASIEIAEAIKYFNKREDIDVIIIGRGGGSIEDLWPFNEEIVADAIYESKIPIISAVGHETDTTIADLVSDLRAATPSQAAEFAVPEVSKVYEDIYMYKRRFVLDARNNINVFKKELKYLISTIKTPGDLINSKRYYISDKLNHIKHITTLKLGKEKERIHILKTNIFEKNPEKEIQNIKNNIKLQKINMQNICQNKIVRYKNNLNLLNEKLKMTDPQNVLERGYILAEKDGKVITSIENIKIDEEIKLSFKDGKVKAKVKEKYEK